eukprot:RCo033594
MGGGPATVAALPPEVLQDILSFVRYPATCLVCRRWCRASHLRHLCGSAFPTPRELSSFPAQGILTVRIHSYFPACVPRVVPDALSEEQREVQVEGSSAVVEPWLQAPVVPPFSAFLGFLSLCRALREVDLVVSLADLRGDPATQGTPPYQQPLEALRGCCPCLNSLTTLSVDLAYTRIGPSEAECLSELRRCPRLTRSTLKLYNNHLGDMGC